MCYKISANINIWVMLWEYVVKDSYHLVNILKYVLPSLEDC